MTHHHIATFGVLGPFKGPAPGALLPDPRAHGNITDMQQCICGATRQVNLNQGFVEHGAWSDPLTPNESEAT